MQNFQPNLPRYATHLRIERTWCLVVFDTLRTLCCAATKNCRYNSAHKSNLLAICAIANEIFYWVQIHVFSFHDKYTNISTPTTSTSP